MRRIADKSVNPCAQMLTWGLKNIPVLSAEIGDIFGNGWIDNTEKNSKLIKK